MKTHEFVAMIEELTRCYRLCNSENSPIIKEINMWRQRYLEAQTNTSQDINRLFLYTPCDVFLDKNPDDVFELVQKQITEKQNEKTDE